MQISTRALGPVPIGGGSTPTRGRAALALLHVGPAASVLDADSRGLGSSDVAGSHLVRLSRREGGRRGGVDPLGLGTVRVAGLNVCAALSKSLNERLAPDTRARIRGLAEDALTAAGALGVLPTPIERVQRTAGLEYRIDLSRVPPGVFDEFIRGRRQVLGLLAYELATVFVDMGLPPERLLFTDAHELGHWVCTWHKESALRADTPDTIDGSTLLTVEAEANAFASEAIFQGGHFEERLSRAPAGIDTALNLAGMYGASLHATAHHFAACNPHDVALLVAGPHAGPDGALPVWYSVESPSFYQRYGPLGGLVPHISQGLAPGFLGGLPAHAMNRPYQPQTRYKVRVGDGTRIGEQFTCDAFFNGHANLLMVTNESAFRPHASYALRTAA